MKKILVFIDWYLPGYKAGGPIRSMANMVSALKDYYHFFIVCRNTDYLETEPYEGIEPDKWLEISENETVYYISLENLSVKRIQKLLKPADYEIIYINGIYSFYYSILPLFLSKLLKAKKIIVAPRGMLSRQAYSSKMLKKKAFISFARLAGLYKKVVFHATSKTEENDLFAFKFSGSSIKMLPNLPPRHEQYEHQKKEKIKAELKLASIARISPEKNTLFALETLLKHNYKGQLVFDIYGSVYDKAYWKKCLEIIAQLPENINVVYKGELNNSMVIGTLQKYDFMFLPSKGENFGHSILEAFFAGCPVIISNKTPWRDLEKQHLGWDLELKTDLFAKAIQKAADLNDEDYKILSESARRFSLIVSENKDLIEEYRNLFG